MALPCNTFADMPKTDSVDQLLTDQCRLLVEKARNYVQSQRLFQPTVACILGSGLGGLAAEVSHAQFIEYQQIPGFTQTHAAGHAGRLITGYLGGVPVVLMQGRSHRYEGHSHAQLQFPVHLMHALGARTLIATNAAGGLNTRFEISDLMVIDSHIDLLWRRGLWPKSNEVPADRLCVANNTADQARHPPLAIRIARGSNPYSHPLIRRVRRIAREQNVVLHQGCYLATLGPTYETRSEYKAFRWMGADAVGMSTIPEVLAARDLGMEVLAFSVITNVASTDVPSLTTHEEVVQSGNKAGPRLQRIIEQLLSDMSGQPD
jgi:purine-nucleoside phosphorylase